MKRTVKPTRTLLRISQPKSDDEADIEKEFPFAWILLFPFIVLGTYFIFVHLKQWSTIKDWYAWGIGIVSMLIAAFSLQNSYRNIALWGLPLIAGLYPSSISAGYPLFVYIIFAFVKGGLAYWACQKIWSLVLEEYAKYIAPPAVDQSDNPYLHNWEMLQNHAVGLPPEGSGDHSADVQESFSRLGFGYIDNSHCAVVFQGGRYSRQLSPGFNVLQGGETITQLIDVRPQIQRFTKQFSTRDGLAFRADVVVKFRIAPPENEFETPQRFPYSSDAILRFVHGYAVNEEGTERDSYERVLDHMILYLAEEISTRTLDQFCSVNEPGVERDRVINQVLIKSASDFSARGIRIDEIRLDSLELPEKVLAVRKESWEGQWIAPIQNNQLGGGISPLSEEQAQIQMEVVQELMDNVDTLYANSTVPFREEVLFKLRRILADVATEGALRSLIPNPKE